MSDSRNGRRHGPDAFGIDRAWFARPSLEVAHDLLGAVLVSGLVVPDDPDGGGEVTLRITEVEAYDGERDPGSHAFRGRTARNATMFGDPGHLYVYRHMGLHHCVNVVCGPPGAAAAVLLRAGEVLTGTATARDRRTRAGVVRRDVDLARGPARLAVALGLTAVHDGLDLLAPGAPVRLRTGADSPGAQPSDIRTGPRVGVSGEGGDGALFPWRLWWADEPTVSTYRAAPARRRRPAHGDHAP